MMNELDYENLTDKLIDDLKSTCATYGLGNDGNEFKIITQAFLYKYLNDYFGYEAKKIESKLFDAKNWETEFSLFNEDSISKLFNRLDPDIALIKPTETISYLFSKQNDSNFSEIFDKTLFDIGMTNDDIFSIHTDEGTHFLLFDEHLSNYITDSSKRNDFCRAIINKLTLFNFEHIFKQGFDFFGGVFEYLISDYNTDGGGKYAEYYTPRSVSKVMAKILVPYPVNNVRCYDPSAGSGTLLMNLAHIIGKNNCSVYSQDISQKSSSLLRLNLILNGLAHSINNVTQGNTILNPTHTNIKFDFIVSNPPFKLDFSEYRDVVASKTSRFFAGVPNIPKKDVDKMAIYLLFIQHVVNQLKDTGRAAIVVPTGFVTSKSGVANTLLKSLVDKEAIYAVVQMPSNIFATTGTNVSVLFIDKSHSGKKVVLVDASKLGTEYNSGNGKKTYLSDNDESKIIDTITNIEEVEDFSKVLDFEDIKQKGYSLSAGQYFDPKIEYIDISADEFNLKMVSHKAKLKDMFKEANDLDNEIFFQLDLLNFNERVKDE